MLWQVIQMSQAPEPSVVWWELSAEHPGWAERELIAHELQMHASAGVVLEAGRVIAYLGDAEAASAAAVAVEHLGAGIHLRPVAESDWAGWQRAFRPIVAGERLQVIPAWLAPDSEVLAAVGRHSPQLPVVIEPGPAFGTGDHPTTAACLGYLSRMIWPGCSVIDAGTGSGVLAIAAALLGAGDVLAVDVDPVACRAAHGNLLRNPAAAAAGTVRIVCGDAAAALGGASADLIVANLFTDLQIELAGVFRGCLRPGGALIASGISTQRAPEVLAAALRVGLRPSGRTIERGWTTFVLRGAGATG